MFCRPAGLCEGLGGLACSLRRPSSVMFGWTQRCIGAFRVSRIWRTESRREYFTSDSSLLFCAYFPILLDQYNDTIYEHALPHEFPLHDSVFVAPIARSALPTRHTLKQPPSLPCTEPGSVESVKTDVRPKPSAQTSSVPY